MIKRSTVLYIILGLTLITSIVVYFSLNKPSQDPGLNLGSVVYFDGLGDFKSQVISPTNTQAVISYEMSGPDVCSIEVSENSSFSPLVNDVNPALFAGSNLDDRVGSISSQNQRIIVIGKRSIEKASDGKNYSRALQTNTSHYYRIKCGTKTATGNFTTANIPSGNTYNEIPIIDSPGAYKRIDWPADRNAGVIDPQTGAFIKKMTTPQDIGGSSDSGFYLGSGAWNYPCGPKLDSQGFFHCAFGPSKSSDYVMAHYAINPTTGEIRFLGSMTFFGQVYGLRQGVVNCTGASLSPIMDPNDPATFYCFVESNDRSAYHLVRVKYTGGDQALPPSSKLGTTCPSGNFGECHQVDILTPTGGLMPLLTKFDPSFEPDKFNVQLRAIQGNYLMMQMSRGTQDTYAWIGAYDLRTNQVVAMTRGWDKAPARWCGVHSYMPLGDEPVASWLGQLFKGLYVKGHGPYTMTLKNAVKASDDVITVTSSWDPAWGPQPAEFSPGQPVSPNPDYFLMPLAIGDKISITSGNRSEYNVIQSISIDKENGTLNLTVKRTNVSSGEPGDYYPRNTNLAPKDHPAGATVFMQCGTERGFGGVVWDFISSPHGNDKPGDYTAPELFYQVNPSGHDDAGGNYFIYGGYHVAKGFGNKSNWPVSNFIYSYPINNNVFGGASAEAHGTAVELHPSYQNYKAPTLAGRNWFSDIRPWAGGYKGNASLVSGNLYKITGQLNWNRKVLPTLAVSKDKPLVDISSELTGDRITGTSADNYKYCVANKDNECVSGSRLGEIFVNLPSLPVPFCDLKNSGGGQGIDICFAPLGGESISISQLIFPPNIDSQTNGNDLNAANMRKLVKLGIWPRGIAITANTKPLRDGSWILFGSDTGQVFMVKVPPHPSSDGTDRSTFVKVPVTIKPPAALGITSAKIYFGYAEDGSPSQYFCNSRRESCVAVSSSINESNPYYYANSESYAPASCTTSCAISIPVIPTRVAYFKISYLNASGQEVASELGVVAEQVAKVLGTASATAPSQQTSTTTQSQQVSSPGSEAPLKFKLSSIEGRSAAGSNQSIAVSIVNPTNSSVISTKDLSPNGQGEYVLNLDISVPKIINIRIKILGYLGQLIKDINTSVTNSLFVLKNFVAGDLNNDNAVNSLDFSLLNSKWNQSDTVSDINQDNLVNSLDFSFMQKNWNTSGE